jgi:hypothetical protein
MNKLVHEFSPQRVFGTFALAFGASLAAGPATWPAIEVPRYSPPARFESYSAVRQSLVQVEQAAIEQAKFEQKISEIYSTLAFQQVPFDEEIATIWEANAEELYWS